MQTKTCTKCGIEKPLAGFYRKKSRSDGYSSQCKVCEYARERARLEDPDVKARRRAYQQEHAASYYSRPEVRSRINAYYRERSSDPAYRERKKEYRREYWRESYEMVGENRRVKSLSMERATRRYARWSKDEDNRLLSHKGAVIDIALELGRSYGSVVNRRAKLLQSK